MVLIFYEMLPMKSFVSGLKLGDREFCIFSIEPYCDATLHHITEVSEAMESLCEKINRDPENLKEVFTIHRRLFNKFYPTVYIELEKPMQIGIGYMINTIRAEGGPVIIYSRQE